MDEKKHAAQPKDKTDNYKNNAPAEKTAQKKQPSPPNDENQSKDKAEDLKPPQNESPYLYPAILLTGGAGIVLEIGLTRIFSIALWHHFAFLSISIALLGLGVSGVFLTLYPVFIGKNPYRNLYRFSWLFSLSVVAAFFIFTRLNLDVRHLFTPLNLVKFVIFYLFLALPFFFQGCVMSALMSRRRELIQKIYFFDLIGAGAGCLVVVFLISFLTGQGVVILSALMSAGAMLLLLKIAPGSERKNFTPALLYALGLLIILPAAARVFPVPLPKDKALYHFIHQKDARVLDTIWNSFSRVDTFSPVGRKTTWGMSEKFPGTMQDQIGITIDGDGFTSIVKFDGNWDKIEYPVYTLNSMVHFLNRGHDALIIGSGGGIDVMAALKLGTRHVDAVEVNPTITKLVKDKYLDYSGRLFQDPRVTLHTAEGRNFIRRSDKKYGLVYLPLVDSWAATYSGAYSLSENFLYTEEAFRDYFSHVEQDGFISISRWEKLAGGQPIQTLRLCSLAMAATDGNLDRSVIITSHGRLANFIVKKGEFTPGELKFISDFSRDRGFRIVFMPGMKWEFLPLLRRSQWQRFTRNFPLDLSPVTDDRPFFYLTDRWRYLGVYVSNTLRQGTPFPVVFTIVFTIIIFSIIFSVIFILLPLKAQGGGDFSTSSSIGFLGYFSLLGLAFMLFEITLMTKFTLFLGNPTYSLSVVLFTLLTFTGIGSYVSSISTIAPEQTVKSAVIILCCIGVAYFFFLDQLLTGFLAGSLALRLIISVILLAPAGICMGIPFPLGLRLLSEQHRDLIPWAWGVNGSASVLGSVLALVLAQAMGFWKTLLLALLLYVGAMFLFSSLSESRALNLDNGENSALS